MNETIERTLELDAPPEDVWRALTDPTELCGWFGDSAEFAATPGSEGWFGWQKHGRFAVRVEELDPLRRFAWRWAKEPGLPIDDTPSTLVEWTLSPRSGGGTTLHLRESGFAEPEHFKSNTGGWKQELQHLIDYLAAA